MLPKRILLAEDDKDDQELFFAFLNNRKDVHLLPAAENGADVLHALNQSLHQLPDVIILDQNMPKMNGLQTLELIKASERLMHIPVMIYSTYTDQQLINSGLKCGACFIATKPVTQKGYNEMLDELLRMI